MATAQMHAKILPPASPRARRLSLAFYIAGGIVALFGLFGYLAGDLQAPFLRGYALEIAKASEAAALRGTQGFLERLLSFNLRFAVLFLMAGALLLLNAMMMRTQKWERYKDFLCLEPALVLLALFVYYPIADMFRISFTDWNLLKGSFKFVGAKNFLWLASGSGKRLVLNSLRITSLYTFWEIAMSLGVGLLLALFFNRMNRYFNFLRSMVFMPRYIATSTSAIVFMWILNGPYGILNYALKLFGVTGPNWLNDADTALTGILILTFWRTVGYAMMIYLSAMQSIPRDYYEAAMIDGADGAHRFRYITFPLLAPTTLFLFVTTFISSMRVFQSVDVMTGGGPYDSTMVMVQLIYNLAFDDFRVDRASAVSVLFFVILLACTTLTMKYSNRSVHYDQ